MLPNIFFSLEKGWVEQLINIKFVSRVTLFLHPTILTSLLAATTSSITLQLLPHAKQHNSHVCSHRKEPLQLVTLKVKKEKRTTVIVV
jgi:hypothetical protein